MAPPTIGHNFKARLVCCSEKALKDVHPELGNEVSLLSEECGGLSGCCMIRECLDPESKLKYHAAEHPGF